MEFLPEDKGIRVAPRRKVNDREGRAKYLDKNRTLLDSVRCRYLAPASQSCTLSLDGQLVILGNGNELPRIWTPSPVWNHYAVRWVRNTVARKALHKTWPCDYS